MRILILTQYYPPEMGAPQNRLAGLSRHLMVSGHEVTVLTAFPNYPKGEIYDEFRGRMVVTECANGIRIVRTWVYATKSKKFFKRLTNYFSFTFSSLICGLLKVRMQDIVIVESPPLFLGISGFLLSRFKHAKFVMNVSDLWPESAVAMGVLQNKILIRLSTILEEFLYRRSALITGQTQGIVGNIASRLPSKRLHLYTNGVDIERFEGACLEEGAQQARREFDLEGKVVIGYAGLHGLAQDLDTILKAAQELREYEDLLFAFWGDGPEKVRLLSLKDELGLKNVRFYPAESSSKIPKILSIFDIAMIPLKRLDLFKGALPSKMFEAMGAGIPMIVSVSGEAQKLVERANSGIYVEPENSQAMVNAILQLRNDPIRRKTLGLNGQNYVKQHYDRRVLAKKLEAQLLDVSASRPHCVINKTQEGTCK